MPLKLARTDDHVMLYSGVGRSSNFNFHYTLNGRISLLDLPTGKWRIYDVHEDFGAGALREMTGEGGEILVTGNRGAHRWDAEGQTWQFLDPNGELKNPALGAVAPRDNELWVGYTTESFGVIGRHSIGVLDEKTLTWSYHSPEKIGTACPVERIFAVPSGEVWVLFGRREYFARLALVASARPAPFTEAKPQTPRLPGLGRFADGKWVFPVNIPVARVPKTEPPRPGAMRREDVADLAAIRDRLFVAMDDGVYMGPGKWQRIVEGRVLVIEPSEDGKALLVYPEPPARRPAGSKIKRSRYDPATGKVALEEVELEEGYRQWLYRRYSFLLAGRDRRWRQNWVRVPTAKAGDWTVGPLEAESHRVIETPYGVWIASRGQLIRLDRKRLAEWLEK